MGWLSKFPKIQITKCAFGFHDKETMEYIYIGENAKTDITVCKHCKETFLSRSFLKIREKAQNSMVEILGWKLKEMTMFLSDDKVEFYEITAVKRLSDNEIFSIGDKLVAPYYDYNDLIHSKELVIRGFNIHGFNPETDNLVIPHCSVLFEHTSTYVLSIGVLEKK